MCPRATRGPAETGVRARGSLSGGRATSIGPQSGVVLALALLPCLLQAWSAPLRLSPRCPHGSAPRVPVNSSIFPHHPSRLRSSCTAHPGTDLGPETVSSTPVTVGSRVAAAVPLLGPMFSWQSLLGSVRGTCDLLEAKRTQRRGRGVCDYRAED